MYRRGNENKTANAPSKVAINKIGTPLTHVKSRNP